jgi:hypothetical protein
MFQPLFTDFIRNRTIQWSIAISVLFEIAVSKSIKHTFILFGLPYLTSVVACCRYEPRKNRVKARISKQYKSNSSS